MEQDSSEFRSDITLRAAYYFSESINDVRTIYNAEEALERAKNGKRDVPLSESEIATKVSALVSLIVNEIDQNQDELRDLKYL